MSHPRSAGRTEVHPDVWKDGHALALARWDHRVTGYDKMENFCDALMAAEPRVRFDCREQLHDICLLYLGDFEIALAAFRLLLPAADLCNWRVMTSASSSSEISSPTDSQGRLADAGAPVPADYSLDTFGRRWLDQRAKDPTFELNDDDLDQFDKDCAREFPDGHAASTEDHWKPIQRSFREQATSQAKFI